MRLKRQLKRHVRIPRGWTGMSQRQTKSPCLVLVFATLPRGSQGSGVASINFGNFGDSPLKLLLFLSENVSFRNVIHLGWLCGWLCGGGSL